MATATETTSRNGKTESQVRSAQAEYRAVQERFTETAQRQAEQVQTQLQDAASLGREAVSEYVRGVSRSFQAFVPQAAVNPLQAIDYAFDFWAQATELQRSLLKEIVSVGQESVRSFQKSVDDSTR